MGLLGLFSGLFNKTNKKHKNYHSSSFINNNNKLSESKYIIQFNRTYKKPLKFKINGLSNRNAYENLIYKYYIKKNPLNYTYNDAIIRKINKK